jgi:enterochelin esterase family protein
MSSQITRKKWKLLPVLILFAIPAESWAQAFERASQVTSPEVSEDRSITFRIFAPTADSVKLSSSDLPGYMEGRMMNNDNDGVWSITTDPVPAGAYRYNFNVDGVPTIDPRNPSTSEANENTWSLVVVPGNKMMDTREVPHGAVAEVTYHSESLDRFRRMHVYTPPGYETSNEEYPVFYLLHGAFDSDDAWSTVGRAGFILDNLIAAGEAEPMIVVMPDGHTGPFSMGDQLPMNEFLNDFENDIRPYIESHYRVLTARKNRAMAGLSMGGAHTLNLAIPNLGDYAYIGVFSSGVFELGDMGNDGSRDPSYLDQNKEIMNNDELKEGLELFWFAIGKDDFLLQTSDATVKMLENHGFDVEYKKTSGGHTWLNWRDYLIEFTPRLFK